MKTRILAILLSAVILTACVLPSNAAGFTDVSGTAWYADAVSYLTAMDVILGVTETTFAPRSPVTREQFVTMLYRLAGEPETPEMELPFTDLSSAYSTLPIRWAVAEGIVRGKTETRFDPRGILTREQAAVMMERTYGWACRKGLIVPLSVPEDPAPCALADLSDFGKVSPYALQSVRWAYSLGLMNGIPIGDDLLFCPKAETTRAQAAVLLMRLALEMNIVPAPALVTTENETRTLSDTDTIHLYRLLHNSQWRKTWYCEYIPVYVLQLWGTEYLFTAKDEAYPGFNVITAGGEAYGMTGDNVQHILDFIYDTFRFYNKCWGQAMSLTPLQ